MAVEALAPPEERIKGLPGGAILPPRMKPYRLWSLLEIMERYRLDEVLPALGTIEMCSSLSLERLSVHLSNPDHLRLLCVCVGLLQGQCEQLELKGALRTTKNIQRTFQTIPINLDYLNHLLVELLGRFKDELGETVFFSLSTEEAKHYQEPIKDWELIAGRFPGSLSDIEEARKCFAVSRYAACVFHTTHIIEIGLIELGTFIGVQDPHSGWTAVSNALSKLLKKSYNDLTDFEKRNRPFLEQVQATVEAMKNSWRNKISHAEGKLYVMTADFSAEIAEEILYAARSFMRKLAEGLPR